MKYDLPLHMSEPYVEFLKQNEDKVFSVYFTLSTALNSDARIQHNNWTFDSIVRILQQVPKGIKRYITLNGRYTPLTYYSSDKMNSFMEQLEYLVDHCDLTGVLYLDYYYLRRMGELRPDLCARIEAVPSVNNNLDSIDKINSQLVYIKDAGFKAPSKIIIDRSLNRRMEDLQRVSAAIRKKHPDMVIETLVNEGCIYQCPFKINHDTVISMVNDKTAAGIDYLNTSAQNNDFDFGALNEKHGCIDYVMKQPNRFFEMPFVRPEDGHHYNGLVDVFKLSGKVHPDEFVFQAFQAYEEGKWEGNLLDIMDAAGSLRRNYFVFNDEIPQHFHKMLTTCDKDCNTCKFCENIGKKVVQKLKG